MENPDKNDRKSKKDKSHSIPNHWEPVPGQALAAEEIARRIEAEEQERRLKEKKNN